MNAIVLPVLLVLSVLQFAEVPVELIVASMQRLDGRLAQIEQHVRNGQPSAGSPGTDRSYALAERLARQGASAQEIAETCGLYITEAELLLRLHGNRPG